MYPAEDHGKAAAMTSHSDAMRQFREGLRESHSKIQLQKGFEWAKCNYKTEIQVISVSETKQPLKHLAFLGSCANSSLLPPSSTSEADVPFLSSLLLPPHKSLRVWLC